VKVFPKVLIPEATRLPRAPSYCESDKDSGRCMLALRYQWGDGPKAKVSILVRNCYRSRNAVEGAIVVENARDLFPSSYLRRCGGASLGRVLKRRRMRAGCTALHRGPWICVEPMHNCMLEYTVEEFEEIWKTNQHEAPMDSIAAWQFQPDATPTMRLIKLHWKQRRVHEGWTADRIRRVCALWKLTPFELGELIQWAPGRMDSFINGCDVNLPGPVAVWFFFLENFPLGIPVFPDLGGATEKAAS
jgi:hypothetical protein